MSTDDGSQFAQMLELDPRNYKYIPDNILAGLERYAAGSPVGDFLTAVFSNLLTEAVGRADAHSMRALPAIVCYVYNEMPPNCHGSRAVHDAWLQLHDAKRRGASDDEIQKRTRVTFLHKQLAHRWRSGDVGLPNEDSP